MNNTWKSFIASQGAEIDQDIVENLGDRDAALSALESGPVLCELSRWGLIRVAGEDAASFMQGQFSNDVNALTEESAQLNSYNSPKGRMYTCFRLFLHEGNYYLRLPREILDPVLKRLTMFVLRSQVTLENISDDVVQFGLCGENLDSALAAAGLEAPTDDNRVKHSDDMHIVKLPGSPSRLLFIAKPEKAQTVWNTLTEHAQASTDEAWRLAEIRAGQPEIYSSTMEHFVAQMANLDVTGGISFNKGCYTGQEIIARTHYLGKQKRRMYRLKLHNNETPYASEKIYPHSNDQQAVGEVVAAAGSKEFGYELLAVLQISSVGQETLCLGDANGPELTLLDLPYSLPQD